MEIQIIEPKYHDCSIKKNKFVLYLVKHDDFDSFSKIAKKNQKKTFLIMPFY